jgi:Phage tail tube protein
MSLQMVPTTVHRYLKLPQIVEETVPGATQTSAAFVDASVINSIRTTYANASEQYNKLGKRTMYKLLKMGIDHTYSISFSPVDTQLIRYGTELGNALGTLAGTIDKHLTLANSGYQNTWGANGPLKETFYLRQGSKCDSITVTTTSRGMVVVDMDMICMKIAQSQAADGGLTTPVWVVAPTTATPWSNLSGGCSGKLTIGGIPYPFKSFSFTVNNNLDAVDVDGCDFVAWLEPTRKEVTVTCELLVQKDNALETAMDAGNGLPCDLILNSTGPKKATFANLFLQQKTQDDDSSETTVKTATYTGTADDVTVTA